MIEALAITRSYIKRLTLGYVKIELKMEFLARVILVLCIGTDMKMQTFKE